MPDGTGSSILVIDSVAQWHLGWVDGQTGQYTPIANGTVTNLNVKEGNQNTFAVLVQGNHVSNIVNGQQQTSTLTLPDRGTTGEVKVVGGYAITDNVPGSITNIDGFTVEVQN